MNSTTELADETTALVDGDSLFQLQLQVARRADEVAREIGDPRIPVWFAWIQAEREVFAGLEM